MEPTEGETQSEENYVYEEPEYKYSIIETDGSISDIDLDLTSYNTDSDSSGYNNFKCAPNGDVFFSVGSNQELIVQFDGKTFEENALIKAKTYYNKYHLPTISDDSGLVVKALNGAPGIYSKRYSGGNDQDNINLLLKKLKNEKDRSAFFECAICYYDGDAHYFIGKCHGDIGFIPEGDDGFGYNPIFLYNGKSFAQISLDEKNKISHRARAINEFVKYIKEKITFKSKDILKKTLQIS